MDNLTLEKSHRPVIAFFLRDQKDLVVYVLTLDLIQNALWLFIVCPWEVGPYVCSGNGKIESQCSQGKEDTKLDWNVYTYQAEIAEKILTTSFGQKCLFSGNHIYFPKVGVTASNLVAGKEKMGSWGGGSKLFQIDLTLLDVRLVIGVSIDIFLVFFFMCFFKIMPRGWM